MKKPKKPEQVEVPGGDAMAEAAREEERKAVKFEEIDRTNLQHIRAKFGLCDPPPLPSEVRKRTAAEVERERVEFLAIKHGLAPAPELPKSDRVDESRPHSAAVNARPVMTMVEAMRLDREGNLPMHKGRPTAVLTDEGWFTPSSTAPTPPSGALLSDEVKRIKVRPSRHNRRR